MSDQTKPTDEDYARDLHADLAVAEAATKGPWISAWDDIDLSVEADDGTATMIASADGAQVVGTRYYDGPRLACKAPDARAIASNRLAAPAAMRRAIEAEDAILAYVDATTRQDIDDHHDATGWLWDLASQIRNARKGDETT